MTTSSHRVAFLLVALACVGAAGIGGYLATRHLQPTPVAATSSAPPAEAGAGRALSDTAPAPAESASPPAPESAPAPAVENSPSRSVPAGEVARQEPRDHEATEAAQTRKVGPNEAGPEPSRPASNTSRVAATPPAPRAQQAPQVASRAPEPTPSVNTPPDGTDSLNGASATEQPAPRRPAPDPLVLGEPSLPPAPRPDPAVTFGPDPGAPGPLPEAIEVSDEPTYVELVVGAGSVLGLELETSVSSEDARVEDPVEARVTRDVVVDNVVAIPAGSQVQGSVTLVEQGGKIREQARLGVRFHTLVLTDALDEDAKTIVPLNTETIFRDGRSPTASSAARIGGAAAGGAVLGAILGGGRGAAIGGAIGAAGGTAAVTAGRRDPATLSAGSTVTVRILDPVSVVADPR